MTDVYSTMGHSVTDPLSPRAARSREKMMRAATDLLVDHGPRSVTVNAVAEASGVAKSTLYRHWPSRDEMLVDVVRCAVPVVAEPDLTGSFDVVLRDFMASAAAALSDPEWSRIIPALMSLRKTMPELAEIVEADREAKTATLRSILDLGIRSERIPTGLDPADVDKLLLGPLIFAALLDEHDRMVRLADVVVDRFLASFD